jgi:hypothetical protein
MSSSKISSGQRRQQLKCDISHDLKDLSFANEDSRDLMERQQYAREQDTLDYLADDFIDNVYLAGRTVYKAFTDKEIERREYFASKEYFDLTMATYPELYGYDFYGDGTGWPEDEVPVWREVY